MNSATSSMSVRAAHSAEISANSIQSPSLSFSSVVATKQLRACVAATSPASDWALRSHPCVALSSHRPAHTLHPRSHPELGKSIDISLAGFYSLEQRSNAEWHYMSDLTYNASERVRKTGRWHGFTARLRRLRFPGRHASKPGSHCDGFSAVNRCRCLNLARCRALAHDAMSCESMTAVLIGVWSTVLIPMPL